MSVRTRFAPSPTGHLHVGGARTALFAWLHARHHGGEFALRIEDTDRERSTPEFEAAILEAMAWLGLDYDIGPVYQSRRLERYAQIAEQLLRAGHAYRCYCTREELEALRERQLAAREKPRYDGRCRSRRGPAPSGAAPVVRFRTPLEGEVVVEDLVRGRVRFANDELDDLILVRSDGSPTYNFCVVVDDLDMAVTTVIRGDDHLNNTPRQIHILRALGGALPEYAHVPMILGADGKRLSKRHGDVSVLEYRARGYLPHALLNYLVRLGWSHGDQEVFTRAELAALFDVRQVNRAASVFNPDKLDWLNAHYLREAPPSALAPLLRDALVRMGEDPSCGPDPADAVAAFRERVSTVDELASRAAPYYRAEVRLDEAAVRKHFKRELEPALAGARDALAALPAWTAAAIRDALAHQAAEAGVKFGPLAQLMRVAVTGGDVSPSIDATLVLVGRERTLTRLEHALGQLRASLDGGGGQP
jgi:glutamyl-tRNA synthetase